MQQRLASSAQVRKYAKAIDRESAREMLTARAASASDAQDADGPAQDAAPAPRGRAGKEPPSTFEQILKSPVTRTVAGTITRGLMGALMGSLGIRRRAPRRRY